MEYKRLDNHIAYIHKISRNKAQKLIQNERVKLHGYPITRNDRSVKPNEEYVVDLAESDNIATIAHDYSIKLNIIYEDDYIVIVNKQSGVTVHPGAGTGNNTLLNAVAAHFPHSQPRMVHRLDKDTSGLIVIAKNEESHTFLSMLLSDRMINREYLAVVWGKLCLPYGTIKTYIAPKRSNREMMCVTKATGKLAITNYSVEKAIGKASLIKCKLETGRTHQIRVHMSHIGHSIVGDQIYGKNSSKNARYAKNSDFICTFKRQALHAYRLGFHHPQSKEYIEFQSDLPQDIKTLISEFENLVI
jgi:23S rRNA pseudouridine1911/1915/1917 synthase